MNLLRIVLAGAVLCFLGVAQAEECHLSILAKVKMVPLADKRAELVPVEIAGTPQRLLIDTGTAGSILTAKAADAMHLKQVEGELRMFSLAGDSSTLSTRASLSIGNLKFNTVVFQIAPESLGSLDHDGISGLLGIDVMHQFDVSIDYGTDELTLLSQDHCEGKVVYWPATVLAVVPITFTRNGRIILPITVDGKSFRAILDTGAWNTTLKARTAKAQFGVIPGSPDSPQSGKFSDGSPTFKHVFKTMAFEGIGVSNVEIELIPDLVSEHISSTHETGSRIPKESSQADPEMLLGMNVLRHFHIYIAYKEQKLYITPAGTPKAN